MQRDVAEALLELLTQGQTGALATVVRVAGSTPQKPGARMLLLPDDSTLGTVGGGAIEQAVLAALQKARESGGSELLVRELGQDLAMCCGGRMEIFVEAIGYAPRLVLCGAGHVAFHIAGLARAVGFGVTVIDEREELNNEARFPACTRECTDPASALRRVAPGTRDFVLVATHDHHLDESVLERALETQAGYIGLVGSRRKVFRLLERIAVRQRVVLDERALERVFAPVGLDIGAVGPEEIAVSVMAELIAVRRGRSGPGTRHMRAVDDPRFRALLARSEGHE
ncbi:MAG: XdhC/CoxI family protein [Myxococcales bacterium]